MATATELRAQLRAQMRRKRLVRFDKRFASYATTAYVASVGADLVMFLLIDDRIRFDGFQILRIRDLRGLREEPRAEFVETVLRRRRLRRPATPRIRLGRFGDALRSASRQFPLVAIHRERADPDVCHIGAVVEVQEHRVVLREVDTSAGWEDELDHYSLREITRLDFGGGYEDALDIASGKQPPLR